LTQAVMNDCVYLLFLDDLPTQTYTKYVCTSMKCYVYVYKYSPQKCVCIYVFSPSNWLSQRHVFRWRHDWL